MGLMETFRRNMWEMFLFAFGIAAIVISAHLPNVWSKGSKDAASFVYGSPTCIEQVAWPISPARVFFLVTNLSFYCTPKKKFAGMRFTAPEST